MKKIVLYLFLSAGLSTTFLSGQAERYQTTKALNDAYTNDMVRADLGLSKEELPDEIINKSCFES